jgi:uncharacterized protein YoxC
MLADRKMSAFPVLEKNTIGDRLASLENTQKTIAEGVRRVFDKTIAVEQKQKKCTVRIKDFSEKLSQQEERLAAVSHASELPDLASFSTEVETFEARAGRNFYHDDSSTEVEETRGGGFSTRPGHRELELRSREVDWEAVNLEEDVEKRLASVQNRVDALQEMLDSRIIPQLWELGRQVPDATSGVDRLCAQCQEFFSKVEAHDVRLRLLGTAVETQDNGLHALAERVERAVAQGHRRGGDTALADAEKLTGRLDAHAQAIEEVRASLQDVWTRVMLRTRGPQRIVERSALSSSMTLPTLPQTRDSLDSYECAPVPAEPDRDA